MNIGIIGTGRIGTGLGKHWAGKGHQLLFGSRDPQRAADLGEIIGPNVRVGTIPQAAEFGEVVVLAVPWAAAADVVKAAGSLIGKTLIECTNPIVWAADGMRLAVEGTSGAEEIAKWAKGAHVVKAFNTTYAQVIHAGPQFGSQHANVFYCGDDASAKATVARLAEEIGFEPIDLGPLKMARYLEPFAVIMIQLQRLPGMSADMGYTLLRR